jgi:hypothetical protein
MLARGCLDLRARGGCEMAWRWRRGRGGAGPCAQVLMWSVMVVVVDDMVWYGTQACCGGWRVVCDACGCLCDRRDIADWVCVRGLRRDGPGKKRRNEETCSRRMQCSVMSEGISTYVSGPDSLQKSPHVPRYECGYLSITAPRAPPSVATHGKTLSVATNGYQWRRWRNHGRWIRWCADWWVIR